MRASLKKEITSEIKGQLIESQNKLFKLLTPRNEEKRLKNPNLSKRIELGAYFTPTKSVKLNSTQSSGTNVVRNIDQRIHIQMK